MDLHQNLQWPAFKSAPKHTSNKNNAKEEIEIPTQQPSCSKLSPGKNQSNSKNIVVNKENVNKIKPSFKDKILTQINNNKIQISNRSEPNFTKLHSIKQYKGKREQSNIFI